MNKKNSSRTQLDEIDIQILKLLQQDATLSCNQLSEKLSLSLTPCWRRKKRLEDLGFITSYEAVLNTRKLGFEVLAYINIRFDQHNSREPDQFEKTIADLPQVLSCHKVTGDYDYILIVISEDLESYSQFIEKVLRKQKGIIHIQSNLALREIKFDRTISLV
ncbi:Lrp/AsnC family transcriptional regulator [Acinetobacter soli]|uniref:Lrp/AsnC family transcriptional regulator n=1 Tax=Acinetobacter soli TaxID=487316 RepID=UPI0032B5A30F